MTRLRSAATRFFQGVFGAAILSALPIVLALGATRELSADSPFGILALGQSNAMNSGDGEPIAPTSVLEFDWHILQLVPANDPLAGVGGKGTNVWTRVGDRLVKDRTAPSVVLAVAVVGGTSVRDWAPGGKINGPLKIRVSQLLHHRVHIDLVTWMQGESDHGMPADEYARLLQGVYETVWRAGIHAPMIVATESWFHEPAPNVRSGQALAVDRNRCLVRGPDLDDLLGPKMRWRGAHFTTFAQNIVASRWADTIQHTERFTCPAPDHLTEK